MQIILALAAACAYAAEEERVKKDVLLGTVPYAYQALPYSYSARYDDTRYYPAKYQKTVIAAPTLTAYHVPTVAAAAPAVPAAPFATAQIAAAPVAAPIGPVVPSTISAYSTHSVHPVPYANYPYQYSAYPFYKSYVY